MARVDREGWIAAAYATFQAQGLAAVRVEPVARRLGVTKGSFYWHFTDRRELLDEVLSRWERLETDEVVAAIERETSPMARLQALLLIVAHRTAQRTGERTLYTDAGPLGVGERVARVTERRIAVVTELLTGLGAVDDARRRAIAVVSAIVGYQQLTIDGWDPREEPTALVTALLAIATHGLPVAHPNV